MKPRLELPTFAALMLSVLITVWLGLWGPIFSVEFRTLNDSPGLAAWIQAAVSGLAMLVVYLSATIPMRQQANERETEKRLRADGLKLLLLPDVLVLKGEIETHIDSGSIYDTPIEVPAGLASKTDQLYLLGEAGGRLLQTVGIVNGVAAQTRRYQAAATVNGVPIQSKAGAGLQIWRNNVSSLDLCLMNLNEFIELVQSAR